MSSGSKSNDNSGGGWGGRKGKSSSASTCTGLEDAAKSSHVTLHLIASLFLALLAPNARTAPGLLSVLGKRIIALIFEAQFGRSCSVDSIRAALTSAFLKEEEEVLKEFRAMTPYEISSCGGAQGED